MILKIIAIGLAAMFLSLTIKKFNSEAALGVILAAGAVILIMMFTEFSGIISSVKEIAVKSGVPDDYIKMIMKVIGIGYLSEFSAAAAKDAGETAIASKIEFASKVSIMFISMPLFLDLINMITGLLP